MQLKLTFSSTPLMAGVCVAYMLFLRALPTYVCEGVDQRVSLCVRAPSELVSAWNLRSGLTD